MTVITCLRCEAAATRRTGECNNHYRQRLHSAKAERVNAVRRAKYAEDPDRQKEASRAYREQNSEAVRKKDRARYPAEAPLRCLQAKAVRDANPERSRQYGRDWRKANPQQKAALEAKRETKKKKAQGAHTGADRQVVFESYARQCAACGSGLEITIDHVAPIEHGGTNAPGNLQCLCARCNSTKRDFRIQFFLPWDGVAPRIWEECELPLLDDCDIVRV